jgi:nickel transport protein
MLRNTLKPLSNLYCLMPAAFSFLIVWLLSSAALAHKVTIFAWVEGDTVYTESKFSGGTMAKNAAIEVYDAAGTKLLAGKTNDNGEFSFKLPKKEELRIVLRAGMGHGNEWTLTAEDIAEAQAESAGSPVDSAPKQPVKTTSEKPASNAEESKEVLGLDNLELQTALEAMLDKKLTPVLKILSYLEAKQKKESGLTEILGGIGYILGLMGLGSFIHFRRKTKELTSESNQE